MKKTLLLSAIAAVLFSCCPAPQETLSVVPYPNDVTIKSGTFDAQGAAFHYSADFDEAAQNLIKGFADRLALVSGSASIVEEGKAGEGFIFILDPAMPEEAYSLKITTKAATVKASSLRGVNYAIQTIKQMLPAQIFGTTPAADQAWTLQCAVINDAPRFSYRGMHMDVSRHFFDMDMVKKYIDIMEVHKLNVLHWHLTDDQGWRIEIKKYPRLTEVGSVRKQTIVGHIFESNKFDGTPYGEGCWFTQDQVREIIAYAAAKAAYTDGWAWHANLIKHLRSNYEMLCDFIRKELPMLKVYPLQATYLAWIDCSALGVDSPHEFFRNEAGVYLDNGANFAAPQCVRLNFATSPEMLLSGLTAMRDAVLSHQENTCL